ncbi:MAG: hypothetical protein OEW04_02640 [Nitrospirota bacterium]|nr:hypothetical protein [Nitrospirota bacterium]
MSGFEKKRKYAREPYDISLDFIILLMQEYEFKRIAAMGKTVDKNPEGIGIITDFPLEAGHVLRWKDNQNKGVLQLAMVKWSRQIDNHCRAGLLLI